MKIKNKAAAALGRKGGRAKTEKKLQASRENGKKGGRPKKTKPETRDEFEIGQECKDCGDMMFEECFLHGAYCVGCNGGCDVCQNGVELSE